MIYGAWGSTFGCACDIGKPSAACDIADIQCSNHITRAKATTAKLEIHLRGSGLDFDGTPSSDVDRCFDFTGYEVNLRHSVTTTSSTITATSTSQTTTSGTTTAVTATSTVTTTTVTAYPSVAFNELVGNTCSDTKTSSGLTSATLDQCKLQCFIDSTCLVKK